MGDAKAVICGLYPGYKRQIRDDAHASLANSADKMEMRNECAAK